MIEDVIKYVNHFLHRTKIEHPNVNETILKSALVYQYLHFKYFTDHLSIGKILENDPDIGLIGPGGCLTWFFEKSLGWNQIMSSHAILHDGFGRFHNQFKMDRGYCYAFDAPDFMKRSMFFGQISGVIYCAFNKIVI